MEKRKYCGVTLYKKLAEDQTFRSTGFYCHRKDIRIGSEGNFLVLKNLYWAYFLYQALLFGRNLRMKRP